MSRVSSLIVAVVLLGVLGLSIYLLRDTATPEPPIITETATTTEAIVTPPPLARGIGTSTEGRAIEQYSFGEGEKTVLFVGGVHGGYEWNSTALAYEFISALETGTLTIPDNLTIIVIPTLNPDGLFRTTGLTGRFTKNDVPLDINYDGTGRFTATGVDLNRNFDCKWKPESTWRSQVVSAGTTPFSEPEAQALRTFVETVRPSAVIFWHSQANAVYASECEDGILPSTVALMNTYAAAADYQAIASFDAYPISGDAEGWLASVGIPAITVELESRTDTEWGRNRAGITAILDLYSQR